MEKRNSFLITLVAAAIVSLPVVCFGEPVSIYELERKGDVYYKNNKPYNGEVEFVYQNENDNDGGECDIAKCDGSVHVGNMKNGRWNGEYRISFAGVVIIENYKDGKKHGESSTTYKGKLQLISNYNNDKQHGERKSFYENGNLWFIQNYKDGKKHGEWKEFDEDGNVKSVTNYKDGEKQ